MPMDSKIKEERQRIFTGKKIYHKKLAELPFEEKIKISRQLAKIAKNIKER
jgi:hypothetical protein